MVGDVGEARPVPLPHTSCHEASLQERYDRHEVQRCSSLWWSPSARGEHGSSELQKRLDCHASLEEVRPSCMHSLACSSICRSCQHGCALDVVGSDQRGKISSLGCTPRTCGHGLDVRPECPTAAGWRTRRHSSRRHLCHWRSAKGERRLQVRQAPHKPRSGAGGAASSDVAQLHSCF